MLVYIPAILITIIIFIFAKKDLHDHIIPHKWWIAGFIPSVFGILFCGINEGFLSIRILITVCICIGLFILGYFRFINGADAFFMIFLMLAFLPLSFFGIIPYGSICLVGALFGAVIMAILSTITHIPFLFPLATSAVCTIIVHFYMSYSL